MPQVVSFRNLHELPDRPGTGSSLDKYADPATIAAHQQPLPVPEPLNRRFTDLTAGGTQGSPLGHAVQAHGKPQEIGGELHHRYARYEDEATREDEDQAMASREKLDEAARDDESAANDVERPGVRSIGHPNYKIGDRKNVR